MKFQYIHEDASVTHNGLSIESSVDPMCGTEVEHKPLAVSLRLGDDVVYFCSEFCRQRFRQDRSELLWLAGVGKRRQSNTPAPMAERRAAHHA